MKKGIIKTIVFTAVFILALVIVSRIMNKGHDNLTIEMSQASFPLVTMETDGVAYNRIYGYAQAWM